MWAFDVQMADGQRVQAITFEDGQIYAHEPICDTYGSVDDLIAAQPGCYVHPVGPVVQVDEARRNLLEDYDNASKRLYDSLALLDKQYEAVNADLDKYGSFNQKTPEAA